MAAGGALGGPVEHLDMAARIDEGHGDWPEEGPTLMRFAAPLTLDKVPAASRHTAVGNA